jgi:hypothetical protein
MKRLCVGTVGILLVLAGSISHVSACSVCFGNPESPLAQGVGWGVVSLLGVVLSVLGGIAGFFVYLARKSAAVSAEGPEAQSITETNNKV